MKRKRPRSETWWCITSGTILLAYTARTTRKQAIADARTDDDSFYLSAFRRVVKLRVTELRLRKR